MQDNTADFQNPSDADLSYVLWWSKWQTTLIHSLLGQIVPGGCGGLQVPGRGGGNIKINSKMAYFEPRPRVVCFIGDVAPLKVNIFLTENMRNFLTIVTQFLDLKSKR